MSNISFTEEELRAAAAAYGSAWCGMELGAGPGHGFSQRYQQRKAQILSLASSRRKRSRTRHSAAACLAAVVLLFAVIVASSPAAYAAVRNWTVNVYNTIVDYTFSHAEDDHAALVCAPQSLPEGFTEAETYHKGYFTRSEYKNAETGENIRFEYRKPTQAQKRRIERQGAGAESVTVANGLTAYYKEGRRNIFTGVRTNKLFWHDKDRNLAFYVYSSLDRDALLEIFSDLSCRLPYYGPSQLPEGYEEASREGSHPYVTVRYRASGGDEIIFRYADLSGAEGLIVDTDAGTMLYEVVQINDIEGHYYEPSGQSGDSTLIWIDEKNNIMFELNGMLSREDMIKLAGSIGCKEPGWQQ